MKRRQEWTAAPFLLSALFLTFAVAANAVLVVDPKIVVEKALEQNMLVVRFTDARVSLVELRLNGAPLAVREAKESFRSGEVTFSLDPNGLPVGRHRLEVVLRAADGKALASTVTDLTIDEKPMAPILIRTPKFGEQVAGEVQIEVQIGPMIKKPFVSLFVDRQFRELRNIPPYRFVWDTTREAPGWHSVEAWAYDEELNTYKSVPIQIYVNNPGGRTERVGEQQRLADPTLGGTGDDGDLLAGSSGLKSAGAGDTIASDAGAAITRPGDVQNLRHGLVSNPDSFVPVAPGAPAKEIALADARVSGQRLVTPPAPNAIAVKQPTTADTPQTVEQSRQTSMPPAKTGTQDGGKVSANPDHTPLVAVASKPVALGATTVTTSVRATPPPAPSAAAAAKPSGAFSIFFDGQEIHFDVSPRTVEGVPVAPFRHLFAHGGGEVGWDNATKTMSADRIGTRIRIRIGDMFATVNDSRVRMERAAFLDAGRTLVPLSFVRQALNVEVEYDPATGHVLITSKE
ncbi:MAG: copper amine oxidase N-terminal domain-containing protein [Fimbriimonadia bacterium]|jgi:hypothetical protein